MNLKQIAVDRAIKTLQSCGAEFHVIFEGKEYGGIKQKQIKRMNFIDEYKQKIDSMIPGDVETFTVDREKSKRMRAAITSYCSQKWGNGSYVSSLRKTTVGFSEVAILRTA